MGYNNSDITLPNQITPSQVLQQGIQLKERQLERSDALAERQRQFNEREQDKKLQNQYKNADIIAEQTDLSKHLTGDTIANDIATKKLAEAMPQFVGMAKAGASPVDLQTAISQWKNNTVPALDNIKREFQLGDEAAKKMKEMNPELNTEALLTDFRKDIHNRTIDPKTGQLIPAHLVQPSEYQSQLTNPDFLSRYVQGNKNLVDAITNPKGLDKASALVGNPDSHVKYEANIPFWKKPNYEPTQAVGGYLPNNVTPQLQIKGSELPMDKLPNSLTAGKPFNIIDKDVYDRFSQDPKTNLELISAVRKDYPQYDSFNNTEKEYIKRHVLYNQIQGLDQSEFHPTGGTKAPRTNINVAANKDINHTQNFVSDFVKAVDSGDTNSVIDVGRRLYAGNGSGAKFDNLRVMSSGNIEIDYHPKVEGGFSKKVETKKLNPEDPNFPYQLAGLYQQLTGSDTKLESAILSNKGGKNAGIPKTKPPKITTKSIKELQGSLND